MTPDDIVNVVREKNFLSHRDAERIKAGIRVYAHEQAEKAAMKMKVEHIKSIFWYCVLFCFLLSSKFDKLLELISKLILV